MYGHLDGGGGVGMLFSPVGGECAGVRGSLPRRQIGSVPVADNV